jgi:ATP-binding cassette subfamily B protein
LLAEPDEPALAVVRYTHRQRRAVENLRFVIEQQLEGRAVPGTDPDEEYARSVAAPIREAQALVAGNQVAVLWRLVGYLGRYKRQVVLGFAAATLITAVSLVPPYLAGFLIDSVVEPVQDGVMAVDRGVLVAWIAVGAMALVFLVRQGAALVRLRHMAVLGEWVARDLRTELYEHLQRLSLGFYSRKKTGSLITRVSSDTDRLWDFRDAPGARGRVAQPGLEAGVGDGGAGARLHLGHLQARGAHESVLHPGMAEVVEGDGCPLGYDSRHERSESLQPGRA